MCKKQYRQKKDAKHDTETYPRYLHSTVEKEKEEGKKGLYTKMPRIWMQPKQWGLGRILRKELEKDGRR
jgi:hypothetical protein